MASDLKRPGDLKPDRRRMSTLGTMAEATRPEQHSQGAPPALLVQVAGRAPHPVAVRAIAFVVGAASLGTEIAAARLLAPYFGASTIIWANTIATVLVAL